LNDQHNEQERDRQLSPDDVWIGSERASGAITQWQAFAAAVQFLTRVPLSAGRPPSAAALARCPVFFPLVGALIGIFTSAVIALTSLFWPTWLAVMFALAVEAVLTGALHEDAVADFCDAFGGGRSREQILAILADSRIGAFGALGLLFGVSLRAGAMIAFVGHWGRAGWTKWGTALVASEALGRYAMVVAMALVPPVVGRESLARSVGRDRSGWDLIVSGLWIVPAITSFVVIMPVRCLAAVALLVVAVGGLIALVRSKLGGMTGDCLGCIGYVAQVVVLMAVAARTHP
jgi:adenosylcobinamide-GDP ribazoletransferase